MNARNSLRFGAGSQVSRIPAGEVRTVDTSRPREVVSGSGPYRIRREVAHNLVEVYLFESREARSASRRAGDAVATWDAVDGVWTAI